MPVPTPRKDEVLLKVEASSLNAFDCRIKKGVARPILPRKFPYIPGKFGLVLNFVDWNLLITDVLLECILICVVLTCVGHFSVSPPVRWLLKILSSLLKYDDVFCIRWCILHTMKQVIFFIILNFFNFSVNLIVHSRKLQHWAALIFLKHYPLRCPTPITIFGSYCCYGCPTITLLCILTESVLLEQQLM